MKGRRRARRAALQALYELDLTTHDLDAVIQQRTAEMVLTSLKGALGPELAARALHLVDSEADGALPDAEWLGDTLGLVPAEADDVARVLSGVRAQAAYADTLVRGVWANRAALDQVIAAIAPEWPVDQMAPLDRNIMRMAIWEISSTSSPERVAISEAVELARQFSGEGSRRMVNGALGTYAAERASFAPLQGEAQ